MIPIFIGSQQTQHVELHNCSLDHVRHLTRSKHEAHGGEDNQLATAGPIVQGRLLTHRARGKHDDEEDLRWRFPSPAGCREELLDPPNLGSTAAVDHDVFWKSDQVFRFFPSGCLYRRRGSVRSGPGGPHHRAARPGPGPRPPGGEAASWLGFVSSLVLWKLR
jgi:hypothetical protein